MNAQNAPCLSDSDLVRLWNQELSGPEMAAFQGHLASCPACSQRWKDYSRDADLLAETLRKPHPRSPVPVGPCLSDEQVADYVSGVTTATESEDASPQVRATAQEAMRQVKTGE